VRRWILGGIALAWGVFAQEAIIPLEEALIQRLGVKLVRPQVNPKLSLGFVPAVVTVPPQAETLISAPVAGRLEKVFVATGDQVAAQQPVALLLSPEFLAVQQRLLAAYQDLIVAQASFAREKLLFEEGVIAKSRFLETEKRKQQASASFAQVRAELEALGMPLPAQERLLKTKKLKAHLELLSPIAGVVTERKATAGQWVDRLAPILQVTSTADLWLEMAVPVERAERLRVGAQVLVEPQGASGKVFLIGKTVDPSTQTVLVRAKLEITGDLQPGRKVTAELLEAASAPLLKLPASALVEHQGERFVFVRVPAGFRVQKVSVAQENAKEVFLTGLDPALEVAVQGTAALKAAWVGEEAEE
jgi:cobalt-zinc-cadmium efflux system membrane fusion protein